LVLKHVYNIVGIFTNIVTIYRIFKSKFSLKLTLKILTSNVAMS